MPYEFREVICPYCKHQFMFQKTEDGVRIYDCRDKITGKKMYVAICPECRGFLYAIENFLEGVREDDDRVARIGFE